MKFLKNKKNFGRFKYKILNPGTKNPKKLNRSNPQIARFEEELNNLVNENIFLKTVYWKNCKGTGQCCQDVDCQNLVKIKLKLYGKLERDTSWAVKHELLSTPNWAPQIEYYIFYFNPLSQWKYEKLSKEEQNKKSKSVHIDHDEDHMMMELEIEFEHELPTYKFKFNSDEIDKVKNKTIKLYDSTKFIPKPIF